MSPKLFWRRLLTKLITLKSNIFTAKNITSFLLVLIGGIFIAPIGLQLVFAADYNSRFIQPELVSENLQVEQIVIFADTSVAEILEARIDVSKQILELNSRVNLLIGGKVTKNNNITRKAADFAAKADVPENKLRVDYMSTNSYVFCKRLKEQFKFEEVTIISQKRQLPRLLYTCNSLGIDTQGIVAAGSYNNVLTESWQLVRDIWYINFIL